MGGGQTPADARSGGDCPEERPGDLLRLRPPTAGLRPPAAAAVRVRTPLGDHRILRVRSAAGELPGLRGDGGASALGQRKEPFDHQLPLVPGAWAKRLSWQEVASVFHTTWRNVFESVKHAVFWGLLHQDLDHIEAIGVDEIQWQRGHHYLTVVYEIEEGMKRLLWVAEGRTEQSLRGFFQYLTAAGRRSIRFVCSDMCQAYLNVVAEQAGARDPCFGPVPHHEEHE